MKYSTATCFRCGIKYEIQNKYFNFKVKLGERFFCSHSCSTLQRNEDQPPTASDLDRFRERIRGNQWSRKYAVDDAFFATTVRVARSRKKKGKCDLTVEYLKELFEDQGGRCAISNIPLTLDNSDPITQASLDRGYSKRGYIQGNVQFVITPLNFAKQSLFNNDMKRMIQLIVSNNIEFLGIAQSGSASALEAEGRKFESFCPDQILQGPIPRGTVTV